MSVKLTKDQVRRAQIIRGQLSKVRCWMTGYHAGRGHTANTPGGLIPGEDSLRRAILLIDEIAGRAEAAQERTDGR